MDILQADGSNYFSKGHIPITIRHIAGGGHPQHYLDFTNVKHAHAFTEIVVIEKGFGNQWIDGKDYPVTAGDVFCLQGEQEHYFKERTDIEMYNIMFDPERVPVPVERLRTLAGYQVFFLLEPNRRDKDNFSNRLHLPPIALAELTIRVRKLLAECDEQPDGYDVQALSLLIDIVVFLSRQYSRMPAIEERSLYRLGKVIARIERDYRRPWTLDEIAGIAAMSKSTLMVLFREATGFTPIDYLLHFRVRNSMQLLRSSVATISEIAQQSGFSDSNYFSRQFRRITGMSPTEYRRP